jgi:hypothetical protein
LSLSIVYCIVQSEYTYLCWLRGSHSRVHELYCLLGNDPV